MKTLTLTVTTVRGLSEEIDLEVGDDFTVSLPFDRDDMWQIRLNDGGVYGIKRDDLKSFFLR